MKEGGINRVRKRDVRRESDSERCYEGEIQGPLEGEKGKEMDFLLEPPKEHAALLPP